MNDNFNKSLSLWREKEQMALEILNVVGTLRYEKGVEIVLFRKSIFDLRPSEIIDFHNISTQFIDEVIPVTVSLEIVNIIKKLDNLGPSKIDIGNLGIDYVNRKNEFESLNSFVKEKLVDCCSPSNVRSNGKDVVLYGFGRIGRLLARRITEQTGRGEQLRLRAIVLRSKLKDRNLEIEKRMALLEIDSVHGIFHGSIEVVADQDKVMINGNAVNIIFAANPSEIDYTTYGINDALLIDNTGMYRNNEGLSNHLRPGISKVLLTAPGDDIPNIVYGANHNDIDLDNQQIFSAASCTTNAIAPVLKVIDESLKIKNGHIETIHAYTNDQNLVDNFHKKSRRGRAAGMNMVLTTTGAAKAVSKVLPHLAGLLTGNAVRVPTPNVSLAILKLNVEKETSVEDVNKILMESSLNGELVEQIRYSDSTEFVSSHAVGVTTTSVIDAPSTIVSSDSKSIVVYAWYDNEYGYACQVVRLAKHISEVRRCVYP